MKYFLLFLLFIGSVQAQDCSKFKIQLLGDVVFFHKDENNKVIKDIQFNEFPKQWNVNSDRFHSLYINNKSEKSISHVEVHLTSEKVNDFNLSKEFKLSGKDKNGYQKINNIIFHKDVLPNYILLPANMTLKVFNNEELICEEKYKFEVVQ